MVDNPDGEGKLPEYRLNGLKEDIEKGEIALPNVQRGFVWKPWQIENLWDSLMRRFPVGSFVGVEKDGKTELLDGQQRATAIALAFFEPDGTKKNSDGTEKNSQNVLRSSTDRVRLFIDLKKGTGTDRKYVFRVITKSHPWGYQKSRNDRTLSAENIRRAREKYQMADKNPYAEPLDKFWPYDASFPVPFGFFLNGDNAAAVRSKIERWCKRHHQKPFPTGSEYYGIEELLDTVRDVLDNTSLPLLSVREQVLDAETETSAPDGETDADDGDDEIENLFIRLNAGGTPLRGEELNYSILKTNIGIDLQKKIEDACAGFMRPARFITIACRLYQNRPEKPAADAVTMRIRPKQFQGIIRNEKAGFIKFVEKLLDEDFLKRVKAVLRYDPDDNAFGLPDFIVSELADRVPEVMLMLMHRLLYTDDEKKMTEETRRRMLGVVTLLTWFGKGQRDHAPLIGRLWEQVRKTKEADDFWSAGLMRTACEEKENETLFPAFPKFNKLKNGIKEKRGVRIDSLYRWKFEEGDFQPFLSRLFYERSLILYAQRAALNLWFKDCGDFDPEDTLCPFDWDHISPENLIYRKWHIHEALKSWYQTNGNFRAWPFTLNRGARDDAPSEKLSCSKDDFDAILKSIGVADYPYKADVLFDWSKCAKAWKEIDFNDLSKKADPQHEKNKQLIDVIIGRNLDLIRTWYVELRIDDLCPSTK